MIKLENAECIEFMSTLEDKSIDMILCDLPYGTTACKWDNVIPFGKLWEQYNRIIKDNGAIVLFGAEPFSSLLRCSNLKMFKYDWVWIKNTGADALMAKNKPLNRFENICVFSKGTFGTDSKNRMTYYPQGIVEINKTISGKNVPSNNFCPNRVVKDKSFVQTHTNYPKNILEFSKDKGKLHPTQKPVALLEYLIKTYTQEDELVLDNCAGSGSTAIACLNTNRNFIGCELDKGYFDVATKRINDHLASLRKS